MKRIVALCACLLTSAASINAADIKIENAYFTQNTRSQPTETFIVFTISWSDAWHNDRNHDAAWVFMKLVASGGGYQHLRIEQNSFEVIDGGVVPPAVEIPDDQAGLFVYPAQPYRGDVKWRIKVKVDPESIGSANVGASALFAEAIEMVYISEGGFVLGDPDPAALRFSSFYRSDENGQPDGLYRITSSDQEIEIAPRKGALYYEVATPAYQGDQTGIVPASFPNGYDAFYIMKYETRQGQYANFLNTLSAGQSQMRAPFGGKGYFENRGTINIVDGEYTAARPERPANYISWDDGAAFADWAGLRPMTELEFTKAARGPGEPIAHEYPWNTDSNESVARYVNGEGDLVLEDGLDESDLTEENRARFGASYFWVMDLAGSVWEKCVTIGDPIGRSFRGTHGDGRLSGYGAATNSDWPSGIDEAGGYGYRGGGYYQRDSRYTEFNPHSPIAYRPYGSWAGGTRSIAYSNRYVRSAP